MIDDTPQIPVLNQPVSMMEAGPNGNNLAAAASARHPVDHFQQVTTQAPGQHRDLSFARHVYGTGLAMQLAFEQKMAGREQISRTAPGIPSAGLYGDVVTGNDTSIDFRDYLTLPENQPELRKDSPHIDMERQLGM